MKTARIMPDSGERIGDPVQVVVSIQTWVTGTAPPLTASAGGLNQSGRYTAKIGDTINLSASTSARATGGEPIRDASLQDVSIRVTVESLPPPDIGVTGLMWDGQGGVDFGYQISRGDLVSATTVALYWASGFNPDTAIGGPVFSTSTATAVGTYGPIHVDAATLGTRPQGAGYLLAIADPDDLLVEASESNNVQAVPVSKIPTTTTLMGPAESIAGQTATFTATVSSQAPGVPTGLVQFYAGSLYLGAAPLSNGVAVFSTANLPAGFYFMTAEYGGDDDFSFSGADLLHSVNNRARVVVALGLPHNPSVYGTPITIEALFGVAAPGGGTPTGTLTFLDGGVTIQTFVVGPTFAIATFSIATLTAGTHAITAVYSGDANFEGRSDVGFQSVAKAPLTVTADDQEMDASDPIPPLTYTITGFVLNEDESVVQGTADLNTTATPASPPGSYPITVGTGTLAADNYEFKLRVDGTLTVRPVTMLTTTVLTSSTGAFGSTYGQSVTFTATVSPVLPATGIPTGVVEFFAGGILLGSEVLNGGVATISTVNLPAGAHTIIARYEGDGTFEPSDSNTHIQSVEKATTYIIGFFGDSSVYGRELPIQAIVSVFPPAPTLPTGELLLYDSSPNPIDHAIPFNGIGYDFSRNNLAAGTHTMQVVYGGDDNFKSSEFHWIATVAKAPLTVTADNQGMVRGDTVPPLAYTITGFVLGEDESVVRGAPILSTPATPTSPAGRYPIHVGVGSLAADNYHFPTQVDGSLAVRPKVIDVRVEWGSGAERGVKSMSILDLDRTLPFLDIKAIEVVFSDDVDVNSGALALTSETNPRNVYNFRNFNYDPTNRTARWTLSTALDADQLRLDLDGDDAAGDGHDGVHAFGFPDIYLGDYSHGFAVLPGDYDGDRVVDSQDLVGIRNQMLFIGDPALALWADLDGNGVIDLIDYNSARKKLGKRL